MSGHAGQANVQNLTNAGKGRPKGTPNKTTVEIREAAQRLVEDEKYQASLVERLRRGTAPHMETLLFHYAYGKPKDTLAVEQHGPLFALPIGTYVDMGGGNVVLSPTTQAEEQRTHAVVHQALAVGDAGTDAGDGGRAGSDDSGDAGA